MSRSRGTSLILTLMIAAIVVLAAFMLVAIGFFNLNVASRGQSSEVARNLAETTLSIASDQLLQAYTNGALDYGTHNETVHFVYPTNPTLGTGDLTFNQGSATIPWSLTNLANYISAPGSTHVVPASSVDLVAVGQCGTQKRTAEQIIYFPRYGASMTATSTIHSTGGLTVGAISQGSGPVGSVDLTALLPGGIASNSSDPNAAINLGPSTLITGSVQAVGGITLDPAAVVQGAVRAQSSTTAVPQLDITTLNTAGRPNLQTLTQSPLASLPLTGFANSATDLTVTGDITLNRGVLYVNGNLLVQGQVNGLGALIATGTLEIDGAAQLTTDNQVALVSGGDVTLAGQGQANSALQGMIYTNGRLYAHDMTLVGVFVANGANGGAGSMQMDNVTMVSSPDMGLLTFAFNDQVQQSSRNNACIVNYSPTQAQVTAVTSYLASIGYTTSMSPMNLSQLLLLPTSPPATPGMSNGQYLMESLNAQIYVNLGSPGMDYMPPAVNGPTHYVGPMNVDQFIQMGGTFNSMGGANMQTPDVVNWLLPAPPLPPTPNPAIENVTYSLDMDQFLSPEDTARTLYFRIY